MDLLSKISIVLVEPSHPGNIGAAARAMKTMGLSQLTLVQPKSFPAAQANQRAAGGEDLLRSATVVPSLDHALAAKTLVFGTSVRSREVNWPTFTPREAASESLGHLQDHAQAQVAILFGREDRGLENSELDRCSAQICIPANPDYSSLNLGSAVQILAYELRQTLLSAQPVVEETSTANQIQARQRPATQAEREGHLQHLEAVLNDMDFAHNKNSPLLMRKLTRLYNKAQLSIEEVQILRGILTAIEQRSVRS